MDPGKQIPGQGLSTFISSVFLTSSAMDSADYQVIFGGNAEWGVGVILTILLILLLVFLELSSSVNKGNHFFLARLSSRFLNIVSIIILIFFCNVAYRMATILTG